MTAQHAEAGALDATLPDLGAGVPWESVHRARPRAPLTCRGCGGPVHAKVSSGGLRFFAHDARPETCHLLGEGLAHRLLKAALAAAARQAGWTAELEAAGSGWRADVLTTSPDGTQRIAWEAQLAAIAPDEVVRRHDTMTESGLLVCWVSDRERPWTLAVPSVVIATPDDAGGGDDEAGPPAGESRSLVVVGGAARFAASWCEDRRHCDEALYTRVQCSGHGQWEAPLALTLARFVETVCAGAVRPVRPTVHVQRSSARRWCDQPAWVWTARRYAELEREQAAAAEREAAEEERREQERRLHAERIERLVARQEALAEPARQLVGRLTQTQGRIAWDDRGPEWAMGLPVEAGAHGVAAVVCPVAGRIEGAVRRRLADVVLVVLDDRERNRVAKAAVPGQRIEVIPVAVPPPPADVDAHAAISPAQVVRRMFG